MQIKTGDMPKAKVIYTITHNGWLFYVGICGFAEFSILADANYHPEVKRRLEDERFRNETTVTIHAIALDADYNSNVYKQWVDYLWGQYGDKRQNWYNTGRPVTQKRPQRMVARIDVYEEFPNAAAACRKYGIYASNMSEHLQRRGRGKIKGMTFRYLDEMGEI